MITIYSIFPHTHKMSFMRYTNKYWITWCGFSWEETNLGNKLIIQYLHLLDIAAIEIYNVVHNTKIRDYAPTRFCVDCTGDSLWRSTLCVSLAYVVPEISIWSPYHLKIAVSVVVRRLDLILAKVKSCCCTRICEQTWTTFIISSTELHLYDNSTNYF